MYLTLAIIFSYPLIFNFNTHIPLGSETAATVPFFNLWTLQWNIEQLMQGYSTYWDAPIFAFSTGTFAFSEIQPLSAILMLPLWLNFGTGVAYNALIVFFLALNGWFTYCLLLHWQVSKASALGAGIIMQALPFVTQEMGVLQLVAIFGFLWLLLFSYRFFYQVTWQNALALGLGLPAIFFTCSYYGLFSLLFLPLFVAFCGLTDRRLPTADRRLPTADCRPLTADCRLGWFVKLLLVIGLASALTLPILFKQQQILNNQGLIRTDKTIQNNSARLNYYTQVLDYNILYNRLFPKIFPPPPFSPQASGQRLFPGVGLLFLALIGLFFYGGRRSAVGGQLVSYLVVATILAFLLSFGLNLRVIAWYPYELLRRFGPGFAELRSPFRFAAMVQIHLVLLAGLGLNRLSIWFNKWLSSNISLIITIFWVCIIVFEGLALPLPLQKLPELSIVKPWQNHLNQVESKPRVVILPFAPSGAVASFEQTTVWMLENRYFKGEMLNGYSGFFPPNHPNLRQQMLTFPTTESIAFLRELETDYVVIHYKLPNTPSIEAVTTYLPLVYVDEVNKVGIYSLKQLGE